MSGLVPAPVPAVVSAVVPASFPAAVVPASLPAAVVPATVLPSMLVRWTLEVLGVGVLGVGVPPVVEVSERVLEDALRVLVGAVRPSRAVLTAGERVRRFSNC